ncbi:hypothetical protein N7509_001076 [Penicillium cosmopolitanum]|uniref:Uncharacterized protein n=1 Tax=Penicillium cosmopolitanum TaxID=1131564 RepID=A0A9W9WC61_9EURO|nr:uncharacterized protein N7509_001076 [Penicillium cosmopolitanum]KAJ5414449.1 hypothetical protein N7509_001076 [Penicillium cosmopolitanum]
MSVNDLPPSADPTISHTNQPYASDLEALDNRLKRLSEDVFPLHPYLLTLPTNAPFRLSSRSANNWAVGHDRPFSSDEQQLQYMTFLTHDSGDSLLLAVGDWSDESGRMMADRPRTTSTTATENPRDAVSKKKISLKDYNTQKVTSTSVATPTPPPPENHIRERSAHANKREGGAKARATTPTPDLTISNDKLETRSIPTKSQSQQRSLSPTKDSHSSKKRPSASYADLNSHSHSQPPKGSDIMHSPKKPRLSPEKDQRIESQPAKSSRSPRLPALLSPTLPPTAGPRLPRLLSPTLPPDIEKELAKIGGHSPVHHTSPKRENAAIRTKRNDELHQTRTPTSTSVNSGSNSSQQGGSGRAGTSSKDKDSLVPNPPRRIVSLKYGKSNRKRVEALLKFAGKKKAYPTNSTPGADTDPDDVSHSHVERRREGDVSQSRNSVASKKIKSKARHEADETLGSGTVGGRARDRESRTSIDKPTTPAFHPPAHDRTKPNTLTPVKDLKNMVSRHGEPGDGDGKTPINPTNKRYSTDLGAKGSPSQPESRSRDSDRRAWRDEFQKFSSIGRELKHASERYTAMTGPSIADEKLSVVTAIEAILSFILAFVSDNQCKSLARQVGDSSSWVSILAYWRVVRKKSGPYPVLHGLSLLLGAVSYDAIHALDLERLAVSPLPGEHTPAPTPGAGGGDGSHHPTPASSDDYKKAWEKISELRNRLPECYRESQRLWLEGSRGLSEDILSQEFPNTWSRRSHNFAERGRIPLRAGEYAGDYFLPLGGTTQPIEIVRFSWSILHEWCEQEGIDWNERLVL